MRVAGTDIERKSGASFASVWLDDRDKQAEHDATNSHQDDDLEYDDHIMDTEAVIYATECPLDIPETLLFNKQ